MKNLEKQIQAADVERGKNSWKAFVKTWSLPAELWLESSWITEGPEDLKCQIKGFLPVSL